MVSIKSATKELFGYSTIAEKNELIKLEKETRPDAKSDASTANNASDASSKK